MACLGEEAAQKNRFQSQEITGKATRQTFIRGLLGSDQVRLNNTRCWTLQRAPLLKKHPRQQIIVNPGNRRSEHLRAQHRLSLGGALLIEL